MRIQDIRSSLPAVDTRPEAEPAKSGLRRPLDAPATSIHGDVIDLSATAQIAAAAPEQISAATAEQLSPERLAELRARVQSGYYSAPATVATTAARLQDFYRA